MGGTCMKKFLCSILLMFVLSGLIAEGVFSGTYYYPGDPFELPYDTTLVTKDLPISNSETIAQAVVAINGETNLDGFDDYTITIQSPTGNGVVLMNYGCYDGLYLYTTYFNDYGSKSICLADPPAAGHFQPSYGNYLSDFNGSPINGTWTLIIYDSKSNNSGYITSWGLWFATAPTPMPSPTPFQPCTQVISNIDSGDYDGDGLSDIAIFRRSVGLWAIKGISRIYFGSSDDVPVSGDYNGDRTSDIAIFRPTTGLWAIRSVSRIYFGSVSDQPVPGYYTGGRSCAIAIFRPSTGLWAVRGITRFYFGGSADQAVTFYGDGCKKNIGIFRASTGLWAIRGTTRTYFGGSSDHPVAGHYTALYDWSFNLGIFRASTGLWALRGVSRIYFGGETDWPVVGNFTSSPPDNIGIFRNSDGLWAIKGVTRVYFGTNGDLSVAAKVCYAPPGILCTSPTPPPPLIATPTPRPAATARVPTPTQTPYCGNNPLEIKDLEGMMIAHTYSSSSQGWLYRIIPAADPVNVTYYYGYIWDNGNIYANSTTMSSQTAVVIKIEKGTEGFSIQTGDYVSLIYDGANEIKVYLPAVTGATYIYYYVDSNGNTYSDKWLCNLVGTAPTATPVGYKTPTPTPSSPLPPTTTPTPSATTTSPATPSPTLPGYLTPTPYCTSPLEISSLEGMWIAQARASDAMGWRFQITTSFNLHSDYGEIHDNGNTYDPRFTYSTQAVALRITKNVDDVTIQNGDYIQLTYDFGQAVNVYPPALSGDIDVYYYIGTDGSTYSDKWLCELAKAVPTATPAPSFSITPTPTSTPVGSHTPLPTPSSTPTPVGYKTVTPTPSQPTTPTITPAPLMISELEDLWIAHAWSSDTHGWEFRVTKSVEPAGSFGYGYIYDNENAYFFEYTWPNQATAIKISSDNEVYNIQTGDWVAFTYDGGQAVNVYPPAITGSDTVYYYIGSDGATYLDSTLTQLAKAVPTPTVKTASKGVCIPTPAPTLPIIRSATPEPISGK